MPSERVQRRVDRLLDQADEALEQGDWQDARERAAAALRLDPGNDDAIAFQAAAEDALGMTSPHEIVEQSTDSDARPAREADPGSDDTPTSFASDRYQVSKFLGEGGKKRVYQAHDTLLDREVAFALIKTEGFDQTSKERISREAQAMGRLGVHPNIVAVLDLGQEDDGSPYMVTELMGGGDVEALLEITTPEPPPDSGGGTEEPSPWEGEGLGVGRNRLSLERTIEIGKAVCEGLQFAHARGIVHRDLKPGNVWLTEDGTAKIGDFGLAVMTDRSRLTREGMMVGTVSYMPPEQATGGDITARTDLYSLGAMLYEMVTGRPPFLGDEEIAIIGQHINTPPVAPTWHNGDCPRPLEALIMRMLAKDPSERPDSAQDVFNALDAIDLTARGETKEQDQTSLDSLAGGVFVGRQTEMDQLKSALEDVLGGKGRLITLMGEPGIGKTRISEELATYAGLRGAQILWGRCYEGGGAPAYWPWVQVIRSYVREIDPDELRRQMGSSASVVAEIVTDVKDRLPEIMPPPRLDDPDSARFRLFDSITSFLKSASQAQPLLIVLDDLHWSDQPSLTFLEFIARELSQSRVMLIGTYRDVELNRRHALTITLGDLARDRLYNRVLLRGLAEADIARFIEIAAGIDAPRELSATVHRHTEGNPLFVTEVVRDLVQSGELTEASIGGRSSWSVRIPEGVREVIGRRLDRLSDRTNETLTFAAVIGRQFSLAALRELVQDTSESQLLDVLDEALDARVIEELPSSVGDYQFTHALIRETLTGELSAARRVRLHAQIAEALERVWGKEADRHPAELVPHYAEAEPVLGSEKLVHYSILAGEAALDATAAQDALVHFQVALDGFGDGEVDAQQARIQWGLARAQAAVLGSDELQTAFDTALRAFDHYKEIGDARMAGEIAGYPLGLQIFIRGEVEMAERALRLVEPDGVAAGRILVRQGGALWFEHRDVQQADVALDKALAIAEAHNDERLELAGLSARAVIGGEETTDRALRRLNAADQALRLAGSNPDPMFEARAGMHATLSSALLGRLGEAVDHGRSAIKAADKAGNAAWMVATNSFLARALFALGEWEEAESQLARIDPLTEGNPQHLNSITARVMADSYQGLLTDVGDLAEMISAIGDWHPGFPMALMAASVVDRNMPDLGIRNVVQDMIQRSRDSGAGEFQLGVHLGIGLDAFSYHDDIAASEMYGVLEPSHHLLLSGVSVDRVLGLLAHVLGDADRAGEHFEEALGLCRDGGCRPELAWTCSDYAEMLLDRAAGDRSSASGIADREKAIELQDEALAITRELGMRPLTERILARREILRA